MKPLLLIILCVSPGLSFASAAKTFSSVSYNAATYDCCNAPDMSGSLQWVEPGTCSSPSSSCTAATLFAINETLSCEYFKLNQGATSGDHPDGFTSGYQFYVQNPTSDTSTQPPTGLVANAGYYWTGCSSLTIGDNVPASDITCTNTAYSECQ